MTSQSPMESKERRRFILAIAVAVIIATSLGGGLAKVGSGFAARNTNGITVTGSAKTSATADNVVWTLNVSIVRTSVAEAVTKVGSDVTSVTKYLTDGGVPVEQITLGSVSTYANEEWVNGNNTGRILNYRASRDVVVRSKDVQMISKLSQGIGSILQKGISVNNYGPQYYLSTLPELRPQLLEEAMKDAKIRAIAITKAVGGKVGSVQSVKSGVFQVTTPDSTMTADTGAYDTSSIEKTVTSTVSVTFSVK
ncbi:oxidative stress defense protein [Candidatus Nanopelagicaceae bacterium]